jgi:hypothetical protein
VDTRALRVPGNKEAERLAKEGAIEVIPTMPFSVGTKVIKKQLELEH